jgi:pyruvate formate lyase activating enzyme
MTEARFYTRLPDNAVQCGLCAHACRIPDGGCGLCHVRQNRGGTLYTLAYGRTVSEAADPIEKKPLLHFHPGTLAYSIATVGCNFHCRWCQNWQISQATAGHQALFGHAASPEQIVRAAQRAGCRSIACTYTEPTVFAEYALETARLAHAAGLATVFVTNGFMGDALLDALPGLLDAANVDLKAFRDSTYRQYTGGRLEPVLASLRRLRAAGVWLEVTTLLVPGINDDPAELREAAAFLARDLGPDTPWHLSRFFPLYRMADTPATPLATLRRAADIGREAGLRYVYVGNTATEENTLCPGCGAIVLRREGYRVLERRLTAAGACAGCGAAIAGVGLADKAPPAP